MRVQLRQRHHDIVAVGGDDAGRAEAGGSDRHGTGARAQLDTAPALDEELALVGGHEALQEHG
jgi:hypothetical protein